MFLSTLNCFFEICLGELRKPDVKSVFTSSQPNTPIDYHYLIAVTRFNSVRIAMDFTPCLYLPRIMVIHLVPEFNER